MLAPHALSASETNELLTCLEKRFEKNRSRHAAINWNDVEPRLRANPKVVWSLHEMELSGGEPDVVDVDAKTKEFLFFDCSEESPKGRRSLCFDREALDARKEHKPVNSALDMAYEMGISLLNEDQYRFLQTLGAFDLKTSSWIATPAAIRALDGALFCDRRYNHVFVYHNGAQSYYAARGFRGCLRV